MKKNGSQTGFADAKYGWELSNRLPSDCQILYLNNYDWCRGVCNNKSQTIRIERKVFDSPSMKLAESMDCHQTVGFIHQPKCSQSRPVDRLFYSHAYQTFYAFNELIFYFIYKIDEKTLPKYVPVRVPFLHDLIDSNVIIRLRNVSAINWNTSVWIVNNSWFFDKERSLHFFVTRPDACGSHLWITVGVFRMNDSFSCNLFEQGFWLLNIQSTIPLYNRFDENCAKTLF